MKQIPEKLRNPSVYLKAIGMGLGMIVIAWGTPLSAYANHDDTDGWF